MSISSSRGISSSQIGNTNLSSSQQASQSAPTVAQQVSRAIFGRPPPILLDPAQHPAAASILRSLGRFRKKITALAQEDDEAYTFALAQSATAAIDEHGTIYLGEQFLLENAERPEVLIGAIAHEIGHQPHRFMGKNAAAWQRQQLSAEQLDWHCQVEETRADVFAGQALAELGKDCEPLIGYLQAHESGPHRRYLPALDRGAIIRQEHSKRKQVVKLRKQLHPDFDRQKGARQYIRKV